MASWDTPTVNAPTTASYGAPVQDFSSLAGLLQDFEKGREVKRTEEKASLFRNGIPKDSAGNFDIPAAAESAAKVGGLDYAMPLLNLQMAGQIGQGASNVIGGAPGASPQTASLGGGPKPMPRAVTPLPASMPTGPQGDQSGSVMSMVPDGLPPEQTGKIASDVANAFKLDPNAAVPPELVPRIKAKIASLTGVPVSGGAPPAAAPAPAAQPQQVAQAAPAPASGVSDADRLDGEATYIRAQAARAAAVNPKVAETLNKEADTRADKAKQLREQSADTPSIREWKQSGSKLPYDDWVAGAKGDAAVLTERAKSDNKEQQEIITGGRAAQSRLSTLNTVANIVNSDKDLTLGFGAETALKVKKALQQIGLNVGDLSGAQAIDKLNAQLAAESAKSISPRPAQFEFRTFLGNNPGLSLDKAGNLRVIGIFSQLAKRDVDLGRLARQTRDDWGNWDNVVQKYDAKNPIIDPVTRQPITTDSIVAPGPAKPAAASVPQEGAMALNPKTGERLKLQGGKWVPFA